MAWKIQSACYFAFGDTSGKAASRIDRGVFGWKSRGIGMEE